MLEAKKDMKSMKDEEKISHTVRENQKEDFGRSLVTGSL